MMRRLANLTWRNIADTLTQEGPWFKFQSDGQPFFVEFACSSLGYVGFPLVLQFPPTVQNMYSMFWL